MTTHAPKLYNSDTNIIKQLQPGHIHALCLQLVASGIVEVTVNDHTLFGFDNLLKTNLRVKFGKNKDGTLKALSPIALKTSKREEEKKKPAKEKDCGLNSNKSNACQHCFQPSPFPMYLHYLSQRNSTAQRRTVIHYHPHQMHGLLSPDALPCCAAVQLINPPCQVYGKVKYDSRVSAHLLLHQPLPPTSKAIASGALRC